jgi:hypothetical protein
VTRDGHTSVGWANDSRGVEQAAISVRGTEWRLLGSFCDPFGFCQGVLQEIEFTATAVLRF